MRVPEFLQDDLVFHAVFPAKVGKAEKPSMGGHEFGRGRVDVDQDVAPMSREQTRGLVSAHVIVRVYAAYELVLALDGDDGDGEGGQFHGGNGVAQNNQPLNFICEKFLDIEPFAFLAFITDKHEELVVKRFIGGEDLAKHLRIIVMVQVGNDDADKLRLSVRQDSRDLVFLIVQLDERVGNNLLVFQREGVGIVKIAGNRGFGKVRIFCNVAKCHVLL